MFNKAAQGANMNDNSAPLPTGSLIIAGGAIRDLYFDRGSARDIDLYFNSCDIDPHEFARCLKRLDIAAEARNAGFWEAAMIRVSDQPQSAFQDPTDIWATFNRLVSGQQVTQSTATSSIPKQYASNGQTSASGNKMDPGGRAHPLQGVEEFIFHINGHRFTVELMTVAMSPVEYVKTHFAVKLSRCYFDGIQTRYTTDFFEDARNKTITVACPIEHARFDRLFSYYLPKMKTYFPDFDVRVDLTQMNKS